MLRLLLPLFTALVLALPAHSAEPPEASAHGKYQQLLKQIPCPSDAAQYGEFEDEGYTAEEVEYCGTTAPPGYWVYVAPNWYIWAREAPASPQQLEAQKSARGKYKQLVKQFSCPAKLAEEKQEYGAYSDAGFYEEVEYCGQDIPAGYWVYVAPNWYIWARQDLAAIGYAALEKQVKLKAQTVTLRFEYQAKNKAWAEQNLSLVETGLREMEAFSGIPFPGRNPYSIQERKDLPMLGQAGPTGMLLISPPRGTPWTVLHETVHIWNAGVGPKWLGEGHANFISYLFMQKHKRPFAAGETFAELRAAWRQDMEEGKDLPLDGNYDKLSQGKALEYWAILYQLFGPGLIKESLVKGIAKENLTNEDFAALLKKYAPEAPNYFFSGWINAGDYRVLAPADFGPVRFPLP